MKHQTNTKRGKLCVFLNLFFIFSYWIKICQIVHSRLAYGLLLHAAQSLSKTQHFQSTSPAKKCATTAGQSVMIGTVVIVVVVVVVLIVVVLVFVLVVVLVLVVEVVVIAQRVISVVIMRNNSIPLPRTRCRDIVRVLFPPHASLE